MTASNLPEAQISQAVGGNSTQTVATYLMMSGYPGVEIIPAGIWSANLHVSKSLVLTPMSVFVEVYKRDISSNETLLFSTDPVNITNFPSANIVMVTTDVYQPGYTMSVSDNVMIKVKATNGNSSSNTFYLYSEGSTHYSYITTTLGYVSTSGTSGTSGSSGSSGSSGTSGINGSSGTSGLTPTQDWVLSGGLTVSGTSSFLGLTVLQEVTEVINSTPGATASTVVYDFSNGSNWYHSSANTNYTASFINVPTTDNRAITTTIIIDQGATAYIPTSVKINNGANETVRWSGGTASGTANQVDIVGFTFIRSGGAWAQVLGQINTFD